MIWLEFFDQNTISFAEFFVFHLHNEGFLPWGLVCDERVMDHRNLLQLLKVHTAWDPIYKNPQENTAVGKFYQQWIYFSRGRVVALIEENVPEQRVSHIFWSCGSFHFYDWHIFSSNYYVFSLTMLNSSCFEYIIPLFSLLKHDYSVSLKITLSDSIIAPNSGLHTKTSSKLAAYVLKLNCELWN